MKTHVTVILVCALIALGYAADSVPRGKRQSGVRNLGRRDVFLRVNDRWISVSQLESQAKTAVIQKAPDVNWTGLQEVNSWIDPSSVSNRVVVHFSFGLGKRTFLVHFGDQGKIVHIGDGEAIDVVDPPNFTY